ncbi:hypothetical protein VQ196_000147 [Salmonella enterica]|uniref:hypothetical protein n=1 Tax=Salmonella TaxID=590 RepID=UPI000B4D7265|nr:MULTISPECIES: hypothetical protein [Salmonella]EEJ0198145.1 hypothetical protein [Salmonella enterica subsp. enterica]EHN1527911.1 hypothetical protein [Salmonella enterica]HBZ1757536.1 hypothetical protein [Salmonella enterica subsp. enterica serovar Bredeney]HCL5936741.1 hypothetical protein [Citrobacter freundii]EBG0050122.1 hypothetical protein [Salmonella enterica subsp. enterica serovar Schwarzengrund]
MATFSGGDALEAKLAEIAAKLGEGKTLRVGFLEGATYPDGQSVPMVAAANEYGDPAMNRPPRPFFRNMIGEKSPEWPQDIAKIAEATGYDAETMLGLMGEHIKGQLQGSIRDLMEPALSPVTIAKKGFSKPLIETSHMLNSVDYDIKDGV